MSFLPRRSSRSRPNSRSTTPIPEAVFPIKKRKVKNLKPFYKKMSGKTIEALSKMAESVNKSTPNESHNKQFGGIKNIKLSDFSLNEDDAAISKASISAKSIYSGAGIKLDAFDCFHRVLNECVYDYTFSIADAALILKQLTPDIIKKIVPLMSQQQSPKKKPPLKPQDKTEYYHGAIDLEVSEINTENKGKLGTVKQKTTIKRPDASRPTRMLSPGSNSCSPVSAAVQALISISAPIVEDTATKTDVQAEMDADTLLTTLTTSKTSTERDTGMLKEKTVFVPLSKPSTSNEFTDSVFTPIPKPAVTSYSKDASNMKNKNEVCEVLMMSKIDTTHCDTMPILTNQMAYTSTFQFPISSSLMDTTSSTTQRLNAQTVISRTLEATGNLVQKSLTHEDPLPHFNLLLSTPGLSVDLPCGLPSPFTNQMPASPMANVYVSQLSNPPPTSQHEINSTTLSNTNNLSTQSVSHDATYLEQTSSSTEEQISLPINPRLHNQLRTILPKPYIEASTANIVSVIPSSSVVSANTVSQFSPLVKYDDRKTLQYSVSPSQIFTKLNSVGNASQISQMQLTAMSPQQRPLFNQTCIYPAQNVDTLFYAQNKDLKQFVSCNPAISFPLLHENSMKTKAVMNSGLLMTSQGNSKTLTSSGKPENTGGGQLEVASALLSMGTESGPSNDVTKTSDEHQSIEEIIHDSIKNELTHVSVLYTEQGTVKIDDVDIDPQKHQIKKDNFTCGKCHRVFTSVLYLARHIKRVCPDMSQRKWKCDRCSKAFRHPFGLQQHIYTHTGERPHKCEQCSKAFYSANDLRRHERTHSGERPYQCTYCEKRFSTTISLRTHTYIHTGERPHRCPHCTKTFATSSKLSRHVVTHSDKRPFPCDQCVKTFNRSGDLRRHYSQHHGKSRQLLECDQCNKVFATQKCLQNHKSTHKRDFDIAVTQQQNVMEDTPDELLKRTYPQARF